MISAQNISKLIRLDFGLIFLQGKVFVGCVLEQGKALSFFLELAFCQHALLNKASMLLHCSS